MPSINTSGTPVLFTKSGFGRVVVVLAVVLVVVLVVVLAVVLAEVVVVEGASDGIFSERQPVKRSKSAHKIHRFFI